MGFQVRDRRVGYILNKGETLHLNCLPFICKMMLASKANESVSESSKTGLCIKKKVYGCFHEEIFESHLNVTGVQFFRLQIEQKSHTV